MSGIPIDIGPPRPPGPPFLRDGFRPFFLGATAWAVVGMVPWLLFWSVATPTPHAELLAMRWHAHAMVFGFAAAVIAGFLLTAVRNWTGRPTLSGLPLAGLWAAWLVARIAMLVDAVPLWLPAIADVAFGTGLTVAVARPIVSAGQAGRQGGVLSKAATIPIANTLFFAGVIGQWEAGVHWGLYLGFYAVVGLVLSIGRRILPNFIAVGTGHQGPLKNDERLDKAALAVFVVFLVLEVFLGSGIPAALAAAALVLVHAVRLAGWHVRGIWSKPLLWTLFAAYGSIVLGFALLALRPLSLVSPFLGLHALAVGGITLMSAGMMARVSLGHTGRGIGRLPRLLPTAFGLLAAAAMVRVAGPIVLPGSTTASVIASLAAWIAGFALLGAVYARIWVGPPARPGS